MRFRLGPFCLLLLGVATAAAQDAAPKRQLPGPDILAKRIVYAVEGMDRAVRQQLKYQAADGASLPMDVYAPPGLKTGEKRPADGPGRAARVRRARRHPTQP